MALCPIGNSGGRYARSNIAMDCTLCHLGTLARAAPLKLFALSVMSDYASDAHAWRNLTAQRAPACCTLEVHQAGCRLGCGWRLPALGRRRDSQTANPSLPPSRTRESTVRTVRKRECTDLLTVYTVKPSWGACRVCPLAATTNSQQHCIPLRDKSTVG